jgi:hypothetical protein
MTDEEKQNLQGTLVSVFTQHNLDVAVGLTQEGIAIRSQDSRVDCLNLGPVKAATPLRAPDAE